MKEEQTSRREHARRFGDRALGRLQVFEQIHRADRVEGAIFEGQGQRVPFNVTHAPARVVCVRDGERVGGDVDPGHRAAAQSDVVAEKTRAAPHIQDAAWTGAERLVQTGGDPGVSQLRFSAQQRDRAVLVGVPVLAEPEVDVVVDRDRATGISRHTTQRIPAIHEGNAVSSGI